MFQGVYSSLQSPGNMHKFSLINFKRGKKRQDGEGTNVYSWYNINENRTGANLFCRLSTTLSVTIYG